MAAAGLSLFLIMRAFASGCTAMTGVEAIANGVQAFKEPAANNARRTLTWMAGILLFLFLGTSALAVLTRVTPDVVLVAGQPETVETIVSQLARGIFGTGFLYYMLQAGTALILVLAANTSYADFPRLGSFMAGDGYLPKQLKDRGSRLVYSNGMILLTAMSILLLVAFGGETSRLIPLYAIGVFMSFTLSQSGMVVHWWRNREPGWHWSAFVNGLGAVTTFVVLIVLAVAKFTSGAWIVLLLIPILVGYFEWVKRAYRRSAVRVALPQEEELEFSYRSKTQMHNHVMILFSTIDRRLVRAVQYARDQGRRDRRTVRRRHRRQGGECAGRLEPARTRVSADGDRLAVPGDHRPHTRLRVQHPASHPRPRRHRDHAGVRPREGRGVHAPRPGLVLDQERADPDPGSDRR